MMDLRTGTAAYVRKIMLTLLLAVGLSVLLIVLFTNDSPVLAFSSMLRGALVGKKNLGTTLATMTTLLLNAVAFSMANKAGFFNVGIDGDMVVGAMAATIVGIYGEGLPGPILTFLCITAAVIAGMLWAMIPALLYVYLNVNIICVCIMMNSVANYVTQYFIMGPLSAGGVIPRTRDVAVRFLQLLPPTRLNVGIFIVFAILVYIIWLTNKTTFGYELKTVGQNPLHAEFAGISPRKVGVKAMMLSGALAGFSGCIEILGNYGHFLNEFHLGIGSRGLLVALLVNCNLWLLPFSAFFISALSTGSLTLQASSSVPKSLADALTAMFILLVTMESLFLRKRRKNIPAEELVEQQEEKVQRTQMGICITPTEGPPASEIIRADSRTTVNGKEENNNG